LLSGVPYYSVAWAMMNQKAAPECGAPWQFSFPHRFLAHLKLAARPIPYSPLAFSHVFTCPSPFTIHHSPFTIHHSPFSIPYSLFPIPIPYSHSLFPFPFPIPIPIPYSHSLFLFPIPYSHSLFLFPIPYSYSLSLFPIRP